MTLLPFHIVAGAIGLVSGFVALFARKGARLHRASGTVFVYAMLVMAGLGAVIAALKPQRISVVAGLLTFYLVVTGLRTVGRRPAGSRWIDALAPLVALAVGGLGFTFAFAALRSPTGTLDGLPAAPGFIFGTVGLLAAVGDARLLRAGGIQGAPRLARHLWRMCLALWIATSSFFLGQAKVFPKSLRIMPVLAAPVVLVLVLMLYWIVRVRIMKRPPSRPGPRVPPLPSPEPSGSGETMSARHPVAG